MKFQWQDTGSFIGSLYGGGNEIVIKDGLMFVDLSPFTSTVNVSNFRVWLYQSGVKPSAQSNLGCIGWSARDTHYAKQAVWNTDGSITILGGVGQESVEVQKFVLPVPDGVTFD